MINEYIKSNWEKTIRTGWNGKGLPLPAPVTVPCIEERYTCFFYWDTYFANLGLLIDNIEQARNNLNNMKHFVEKMGFIPNGNDEVMFNRSQPPLYAHAVMDYYQKTKDITIINEHYESIKKEYSFWMKKRLTSIGLNQYNASPSESEVLDFYNELKGRGGCFSNLQKEHDSILPYFAEAESGWDFSPRYNGQALNFVQPELNGILFGVECILSKFALKLSKPDEFSFYLQKAKERKILMDKYLKAENGIYYDYDFIANKRSSLITAASFVPFAMRVDNDQKACRDILSALEFENGVSAGDINTGNQGFQWAYPNMWPPLVYWAYQGLINCGLLEDAARILWKYMNAVEYNFEKEGVLWEKYDVRTGDVSHSEYVAPSMLGWVAGVYRYFDGKIR